MGRGDEAATKPGRDEDGAAPIAYGDAVAELEAILDEIEGDAVDIDELSRQVRRAAELIRVCQDRIEGARIEVERVVADLRDTDAVPSADA